MKRMIGIILFLNTYYMNAIEKKRQQNYGVRIKKNYNTHVEYDKEESRRTRDIIKRGAHKFKSRTVPFVPSTL